MAEGAGSSFAANRPGDSGGAVVDSMQVEAVPFAVAELDTMPVIEQAKGILMAQHGCGPEEAFDLLRRASQRFNVPVRVLAARLVERVQRPRPGPQEVLVLPERLQDSLTAPTLGALLD